MNIIINFIFKFHFIRKWFERKAEIMDNTNLNAIKISDIAKYHNISDLAAKKLCDNACKYGLYSKNEDGTYKFVKKNEPYNTN